MQQIIQEIFKDIHFTAEELALLSGTLTKTAINKGAFLLKADEEIEDIFYVHSGCLCSYIIDKEGKEHILQFAVKDWWISDYIALFGRNKIKSVSYIECIKDAVVYRISKSDFDRLCRDIPKVGHFNTQKMEFAFASFHLRILENLTLSAKERYMNFVNAYPSIANTVKNYHIASFLGVTTESLSRIRKELASS